MHPRGDDDRLLVEVVANVGLHFGTKLIIASSKQSAVSHSVVRIIDGLKNICIVFIE